MALLAEIAPDSKQTDTTLALMTKPVTKAHDTRTAYILEPPSPSKRTQDISKFLVTSLSHHEIEASVLPWSTDVTTLQGKPLVSLLELEKSMWTELDEESFNRLRTITLQSSSLLWVSMGDNHPVMQAAIGFLRVLQNENANLRLRYLHLEDSHQIQRIAHDVARVAVVSDPEREFIQIEGALCINRWVPRDDLSGLIASKDEQEGQELVKLGDVQSSLKLIQPSEASKKPIYFDLDDTSSDEIGDCEVEIEVRAVAIE